MVITRRWIVLSLVSSLAVPTSVSAWGGKGHEMQARAALRGLPSSVPSFFRESVEEMAVLISEPDRWRTSEQPALTEIAGPNHTFKWEFAAKPLPANRHLFIADLAKRGKMDPVNGTMRDFGTAPYAMQEWAEMLTAAFRRWREMPETNAVERARKGQHERNIVFMAGVLGHWVTDTSQPMHASIHVHGWHASALNPHGYVGKDLHSRYESAYVNRVIEQEQVTALVDNQPRLLGDWLSDAATHIAAANKHVEQVYIWDKESPFGGGEEAREAAPFTAARLADGARMIRDFWYTAWVRSGQPLPAR